MGFNMTHIQTLLGSLRFLSDHRNRLNGTTGESLSNAEKDIQTMLQRHLDRQESVVIRQDPTQEPLADYMNRHVRLVEHVQLENRLPLYADDNGDIVYDIGDGLDEVFQLRVIVIGHPDEVYLPAAANGSVQHAVNRVVAALEANGRPETPDGAYAAVLSVELDLVGEHRGSVPLTRRDLQLLPDDRLNDEPSV